MIERNKKILEGCGRESENIEMGIILLGGKKKVLWYHTDCLLGLFMYKIFTMRQSSRALEKKIKIQPKIKSIKPQT